MDANFSEPLERIRASLKHATESAAAGKLGEAHALLDSICIDARIAQTCLRVERDRRQELETRAR